MSKDIEVKRTKDISLKLLDLNPKKLRAMVENSKEAIFLARVGGVAIEVFNFTNKKTGEVSQGLRGIFSLLTNDEQAFTATVAYLPGQLMKAIVEQLKGDAMEVSFTNDIFVVASEKNPAGYAYMTEPVLSSAAEEKAAQITQRVICGKLPKTKAIAAPKK
jgi:hypothetical protein